MKGRKKLSSREKEVLKEISDLYKSDNGLEALKQEFGNRVRRKIFTEALIEKGVPSAKAEQYALRLVDKDSREINPELMKMYATDEVSVKSLIRELSARKMTPALYFVYSKKNCKSLMLDSMEKAGSLLNREERNCCNRRSWINR